MYCRTIKDKEAFLDKIRTRATEVGDIDLLRRIQDELNCDESSCLCYHNNCNLDYFGKHRSKIHRPPNADWASRRDCHKFARERLIGYIEREVIENRRILSMAHLRNMFSDFLTELYETADLDATIFSTASLQDYVQKELKNKISILKISRKPFVVSAEIDFETVNHEEIENMIFEQEAQDFALKYRKNILKIKKKALPDSIDSEALDRGECDIPKWLNIFWTTALSGVEKKICNRVDRLSSCYSQDSIYSITRGHIKPRKHISLGIAMKSLTGSRKVIDILNRQGYCISYCSILELETSAAYSSTTNNLLCPSGIQPTSVLSSGVAWDNFDRFVETSSGKNTLHDTVGIIYQSIPTGEELNLIEENNEVSAETEQSTSGNIRDLSGRRKRSFEPDTFETVRDAKQRRPEFWRSSVLPTDDPQNLKRFQEIHFAWVVSHKLQIASTPMWVGYNAKILRDDSKIQKVEYLTQINNTPTDPAVVKETMRRSLQIASECGKSFFSVTYDLAMAKIALRIQSAEAEFQKLFINFGPFHIMLSFFKACGKFISGSGLTNVLIDSEILASGSVGSFVSGKHFNRCKKIHPLLSLALQILHFERFLQSQDYDLENIQKYLEVFNEQQNDHPQITNESLIQLFDKYERYKTETFEGLHGKTPQIYLMYTRFIEYYLQLECSIRTGDFDLFLHVLPKITNVFFTMNHHNYARYMSVYCDKLMNIENTHPGLLDDCRASFLGVRRTSKPFSRIPVDLTLEQTINADAASTASGIVNITNSFSARQKWSITHSLRTSVISKVVEFCDLKSPDDITKDLKKSAIIKSANNLDLLLQSIKQSTNPFGAELSEDHLYNISKGQSVDNEVYEFLASVETAGEKKRTTFIAETREAPDRFDKAIKRNKIINFECKNTQKVKIAGKTKEVKIQRDAFGRLLYASLQKKIDIEKALSYPLAHISFSFCHTDGTICKTTKSVIITELIKHQAEVVDPPEADIDLVDGFYFLHTLKNYPESYGKISKHILKVITYNRKEVHIIFDKYDTPSIKDYEHDLRGEDNVQYDVRKENKRPAEFTKLLRSRNFKEKFVEFLIEDWTRDEMVLLMTETTVKLNYDKCYVYEVSGEGKIKKSIDNNLTCYHEEADTKIVFHICQLNSNYRVRVHCTDSDIPVIMLANFKYLKEDIHITVDLSTGKKKLYLDINEIHAKLGEQLSRSLAICHIFTGNDYNPAFYRKGKKRPFDILKKNTKFQEAFIQLHSGRAELTTSSEVFRVLEEYVCRLYTLKTKSDVNKGRYELFEKSYKCNNQDETIVKKKIVGYDPSVLPPTKQELLQQIKRTSYISSIWCNAHMRSPTEKSPENCGWALMDDKYHHYWFDGPHSPSLGELSSDVQGTLFLFFLRVHDYTPIC